jgi:hypothetical protein
MDMIEPNLESVRRQCEQHVAKLRRRIDELKESGTGRPLVSVDFVADVEKTLDEWETYQEALKRDRTQAR